MNRVQKALSQDLKRLNIKPLPDSELHQLLITAIKSPDEEERKKARNKIILHLLPIIISKCKKYFPEDYLIENTDFINEVVMEILDKAFDNFRIDEQEEGRCALFFKAIQYYFLLAYKNLKRKQFGTHEVSFKEFFNEKGDIEFYQKFKHVIDNTQSLDAGLGRCINEEDLFCINKDDEDEDGDYLERANEISDYPYRDTEQEKYILRKEQLQFLSKEVFPRCSLLDNILLNTSGLGIFPYAVNTHEFSTICEIPLKKINSLKKQTFKKIHDLAQFYLKKQKEMCNVANCNF